MQVYARDRIEAPLAELSTMLMDIQSARLDPDAGDILSWHIAKRREKEDSGKPSTADAEVDSSDGQSSESSSSSSSSDPDPKWEARRISKN